MILTRRPAGARICVDRTKLSFPSVSLRSDLPRSERYNSSVRSAVTPPCGAL